MADEGMADDYDDDFDGLDWLYLEDDFPLADELAETQIPEPGYSGTRAELEAEFFDYDFFEYWDDLEYGADDYWDYDPTRLVPETETGTGQKRKGGTQQAGRKDKKLKMSLLETEGVNIKFVSMAARIERAWQRPAPTKKLETFALLPDWRDKGVYDPASTITTEMPKDMEVAAEGAADAAEGDEEEWEDEEEEGAESDLQARLASLDAETLKSVLRQKMGDAGLEGMDEGAFMETITKMLSGNNDADDAPGSLANNLLGKATQGNDTGLSGWLSRQGVKLDRAAEDDGDDDEAEEDASVATAELSTEQRQSLAQGLQVSPPDSGIEMSKKGTAVTSELALHPHSQGSRGASSRKRAAPAVDGKEAVAAKRKKVTFDVPPSSQPADGVGDGEGPKQEATDVPAEPVTSSDPLASENTLHAPAGKPESAKPAARTTRSRKPVTTKRVETPDDAAESAPAPPVRQTRKRKANDADEDGLENGAPSARKKNAKVDPPAKADAAEGDKGGRKTRAARGRK